MRGKTVIQNPARVETEDIYVSWYFYGVQKFVTLTAEVMFVNRVPFLVTMSQNRRLFTDELLQSRTADQLSNHLTNAVKLYARSAFSIRTIFMDR